MMVIVGIKEDLSQSITSTALDAFSHDEGVHGIRVSEGHPHLVFVEYDERQLRWPDIIEHMDQNGLHGRVCGN